MTLYQTGIQGSITSLFTMDSEFFFLLFFSPKYSLTMALCLTNWPPNSHRFITCFLTQCKNYGLSTHLNLFNQFYQISLAGKLHRGLFLFLNGMITRSLATFKALSRNGRRVFLCPADDLLRQNSYFKLQKFPLVNQDIHNEVDVLLQGNSFTTAWWAKLKVLAKGKLLH